MKQTDGRTLVYHNTSRLKDGRIKTSQFYSDNIQCISNIEFKGLLLYCKLNLISIQLNLSTSNA